jgi:hypothetical protein
MVQQKYERYDFMIVLAGIGSILSLCSAASVTMAGFFTRSFSDKSMMEKLYSVDKDPLDQDTN